MENSRAHSWPRVSSAYSKTLCCRTKTCPEEKNLTGAFSYEINGVVLQYMKSPNDTFKTFLATNITEM